MSNGNPVVSNDPNGASALKTYLESGSLSQATQIYLFLCYFHRDSTPNLTTQQRDQIIRERYRRGERISDLARDFGISPQRVHQIVKPAPKA